MEIRKFNDPVLRKRAIKVKKIDEEIRKIASDMFSIMKEGQGVGLAGPQVGILKRIIVFESDHLKESVLALINPKIIKKSREKAEDAEGCLSFPGIYLEIKRSKEVFVKGLDLGGNIVEIKAKGLLARILQHEIDHLNGTLFFDRLNLLKRIKLKFKNPSLKV